MACMNMFNPDQQHQGHRISFSNDFVVGTAPPSSAPRPSDADFEFSVGTRPMIAADELFFKGRMLPLRSGASSSASSQRVTTLRDELRAHDNDGRPPKGSSSIRWKELLGLKKGANCAAAGKKSEVSTSKNEQEQCSDRGL